MTDEAAAAELMKRPGVFRALKVPRMIIQIAAIADCNGEKLYALCNDGTLWAAWWKAGECQWKLISPIPQDKESHND
jgi:hypothetical protein